MKDAKEALIDSDHPEIVEGQAVYRSGLQQAQPEWLRMVQFP